MCVCECVCVCMCVSIILVLSLLHCSLGTFFSFIFYEREGGRQLAAALIVIIVYFRPLNCWLL